MKGYEYIRLEFDFADLAELNRLGSAGWKVVAVVPSQHGPEETQGFYTSNEPRVRSTYWAILERAVE